jgi:hypothetical protein|nr:MAG TPA: major capsid protein [Caudoviricetes sp.]
MITDANLLLAGQHKADGSIEPQTVTAAAVSSNAVDLRRPLDIGQGQPLFGRFQVHTAAAGGTSMEFQIIAADNDALTTGLQVLGTTGPLALAQLKAGARFACAINPQIASRAKRYLGARFVPQGTFTAGAYTADIGLEIQDGQKAMPSGYTVI